MLTLKLQKLEGVVADLVKNNKTFNSERKKTEKEALNQSFELARLFRKTGGIGAPGTPLANRSVLNRSMLSMMSPGRNRSAFHGSPGVFAPASSAAFTMTPSRLLMTPSKALFKPHLAVAESSPVPGTPNQQAAVNNAPTTNPAVVELEACMRATQIKRDELEKLYVTERQHSINLESMLKEAHRPASRSSTPENYAEMLATMESNGAELEAKFEEATEILDFQQHQILDLESQLALYRDDAADMACKNSWLSLNLIDCSCTLIMSMHTLSGPMPKNLSTDPSERFNDFNN
jgi:hypothetical protein